MPGIDFKFSKCLMSFNLILLGLEVSHNFFKLKKVIFSIQLIVSVVFVFGGKVLLFKRSLNFNYLLVSSVSFVLISGFLFPPQFLAILP